jgi:hypothetical protein
MRLVISGICVLVLIVSAVPSHAADQDVIADWIMGLQYTDPTLPSYGAFMLHDSPGYIDPNGNEYYRVVPYFNHTAVLGLLESDTAGKLDVAEAWISWYLDHMDMDAPIPGVVYDHWYLADGTGETTAPDGIDPAYVNYEDSSDAYAALFLQVASKYIEEGGSIDFLNTPGYKEKFQAIGDVMLALQDPADGLTWAKDGWPVKYLMCNVEVYSGFRSLQKLMDKVFDDEALAQTYELAGDAVKEGIKTEFYNEEDSLYKWAIYDDGFAENADLDLWYPGSAHLAWPILFEMENPNNKKSVYQMIALSESWDGDPNPDWTSSIVDEFGFMWPAIGYAALLAGDVDSAVAQTDFILSSKLPDFPWPYTIDDAGWLLRTLSALEDIGISPSGGDFVQVMIDSIAQHLPTGDPASDQSINNAIGHINNSFNLDLWVDNDHLTSNGRVVFEEGQLAVQELMNVVSGAGPAAGDAQAAIDTLIDVYRTLAQITIDEAIAEAEKSKCYDKNPKKQCTELLDAISNAEAEMELADVILNNGQPDMAVGHYLNAWEYTF